MSCSRETPVGTPRCMPARSSLLALVVRLSPSLFACRPRCSLVALAGRPSQFAPRRFSLAGRPSQFAPRSFPLAPQCPSRNSILERVHGVTLLATCGDERRLEVCKFVVGDSWATSKGRSARGKLRGANCEGERRGRKVRGEGREVSGNSEGRKADIDCPARYLRYV